MIEVSNLRFTYPGSGMASVRGLDFAVAEGEIFGFLGPSGAGKSTTQRVLTGLLTEFEGEASVLGWNLRNLAPEFYERVGVSFEIPTLYQKLTAIENLQYFANLYQGACRSPDELLERIGLSEDGDRRVSQFSKGMRVRLGFVRALMHRPKLLFLDEPTAGLDPLNARIVKELICEARDEGTTVFLTTHDMVVADDLCDRVAFMNEGELACIDTPRALKLAHGRRSVRTEVIQDDGSIEVQEFPLDKLGSNEEFLAVLREEHLETLHSQETSLEEVFLAVTGAKLA